MKRRKLTPKKRAAVIEAAKRSLARGRDPVKDLDRGGLRDISMPCEPGDFHTNFSDVGSHKGHKRGRKPEPWREALDFYAAAPGSPQERADATAEKYGTAADRDDPEAFIHRLHVRRGSAVRK